MMMLLLLVLLVFLWLRLFVQEHLMNLSFSNTLHTGTIPKMITQTSAGKLLSIDTMSPAPEQSGIFAKKLYMKVKKFLRMGTSHIGEVSLILIFLGNPWNSSETLFPSQNLSGNRIRVSWSCFMFLSVVLLSSLMSI